MENSIPLYHRMPSYCYYFVVLSPAAGRYEYLDKKLESIHLRCSTPEADLGSKFYEVVSISAGAPGTPGQRPNLPTNALYWTSIAYLLWDDSDPGLWDAEQRQALIDWLHWGGQIIVSGPDALEQLRNSFLGPYLPATVENARSFNAHDLEDLSYWDWERVPGVGPAAIKPWPGAKLKPTSDAHPVLYTGELFVERQVGRGRIVASSFRLTGEELTSWPGFDCLFNACLLRRPASGTPGERKNWKSRDSVGPIATRSNLSRLDAAQMTAVRFFARDTGVDSYRYAPDIDRADEEE